jgi:hypothetical protein
MHEQHRRALALVDVGQTQTVQLAVMGSERKVGEPVQHLLGRAHRVGHHAILCEWFGPPPAGVTIPVASRARAGIAMT